MMPKTHIRKRSLVAASFVALVCLASVTLAADPLTNWALGASYTYSMAPDDKYADTGGELTDGIYAMAVYSDPAWVGHLRNDFRVITIDLGAIRRINEIKANFLQQWAVGARYPEGVIAEVSADGILWEEVGYAQFSPHKMEMNYGISQSVTFPDLEYDARHVRLTILVDVWMFIDEIEILGSK